MSSPADAVARRPMLVKARLYDDSKHLISWSLRSRFDYKHVNRSILRRGTVGFRWHTDAWNNGLLDGHYESKVVPLEVMISLDIVPAVIV